jgi:hypothetical protein
MIKRRIACGLLASSTACVALASCGEEESDCSDPGALTSCDEADGVVCYNITLQADWSQQNHGIEVPGNGHFTVLVGAMHDSSYVIWEPGGLASAGVERVAEVGKTPTLESEIAEQVDAGHAGDLVCGGSIGPTESVVTGFTATQQHSLLSFLSMLAPSPDWFIGVHDVALRDETTGWIDDVTIDLHLNDAGTEDDSKPFSLDNEDASPHVPISENHEAIFGAGAPALATLHIQRVE